MWFSKTEYPVKLGQKRKADDDNEKIKDTEHKQSQNYIK